MPVIKSSKKRVRQSLKRTARNVRLKRDIRAAIKDFEVQLESKNAKKLNEALVKLTSLFDKAEKKNLYHKNKTARRKSNFALKAKPILAKPTSKASKTKASTGGASKTKTASK